MPRRLQPSADINGVLGRSYFFRGFDSEILAQLALGTRLLEFRSGELLFLEGEVCQGLYIMHSGSVKLYKIAPNGREFILRVLEEGDSFNEVPVFQGGGNPVNASAMEESQVWVVESGTIQKVLDQHPDLYHTIVQRLAQNLRMLVGLLEEMAFFQVTQRLARLLLQAAAAPENLRNVRQDELAARLGTVREVVSRSLRELERRGAINVDRRQITILDINLLRESA